MSLTAYVPTVWVDYVSPDLEALHLNHIEEGIGAVTDELNSFEGAVAAGYQPLSSELTAIAGVSSTGYVKRTGAAAWSTVSSIPQADVTGLVAALATIPALSSTTPAALGTAAVGTGSTAARADHVHQMPTAAQVGAMANPMTTTGDLIYSSSGSTPARLAAGTSSQVLIGGTAPSWASLIPAASHPAHTGDATNTAGSLAMTVKGINGTLLSGLATGILKNTTTTGVPSIAVAGTDYVVPSGSITGSAATLTTGRTIGITGDLTWTSPSFNGSANVAAAGTLASIITAGGPTGSASVVPVITYDAKGRLTTVTTATITPAAIGAQVAGSYQPLEDQRLSTTNSPSLAHLTVGYGSSSVLGLVVGDGNYGLYAGGGALHLRGAASGGIAFDQYAHFAGATTSQASLNIGTNLTNPTTPADGDVWRYGNTYFKGTGLTSYLGSSNTIQNGSNVAIQDPAGTGWTMQLGASNTLDFWNQVSGWGSSPKIRIPAGGFATGSAGIIHSDAAGALSNSALTVAEMPASIQTAQSLVAGQVAIGNGSSGLISSTGLAFASGTLTASGSFVSGNALSRQSNIDGAFAFHGHSTGDTTWANASGVHAGASFTMLSNPSTVYIYTAGSARGTWTSVGLAMNGLINMNGSDISGVGNLTVANVYGSPTFVSSATFSGATTITGTFKPRYITVSGAYTLPSVGEGEVINLVFVASSCSLYTGSQTVDYRNSAGNYAAASSGGVLIGTTGYFSSTTGWCAATLIGCNSGRAHLTF